MATVKAFRVPGIRMWIPSGDHTPPHFHAARRGEWRVKVRIADGLIELVGPPQARIRGADRRAIAEGVARHRSELLSEWEECQAL